MSSPTPRDPDVTAILKQVRAGDGAASSRLFEILYAELRSRADACFRDQLPNQTLQPTALVHEVYLRLIRQPRADFEGRTHFCAVASTAMRQILEDQARRRRADKRGGGRARVTLGGASAPEPAASLDVVAIDDALARLAELDERQARTVDLRFFGGLEVQEIAEVLGISKSTVEKEWRRVRGWLSRELSRA